MRLHLFPFFAKVEVNTAQEVEEIFDAVSYQKGCCVIRMLHNYMGAPVSIVDCLLFPFHLHLLPVLFLFP